MFLRDVKKCDTAVSTRQLLECLVETESSILMLPSVNLSFHHLCEKLLFARRMLPVLCCFNINISLNFKRLSKQSTSLNLCAFVRVIREIAVLTLILLLVSSVMSLYLPYTYCNLISSLLTTLSSNIKLFPLLVSSF